MAQTLKGAEPALNPALAELEKKTGPSNFYRVMAHKPEAMQQFSALYKAVMGPGTLERRLKEMVYLAASIVNESDYCTVHHMKGAKAAGLTDNEIADIETETNLHFNPKEQAALRYARELTRNADAEDDTRYEVEEIFAPDQVVELTMVICLANFTNRFNNGLSIHPE